jgi:two-component system, NtrC family, sensor kinase
MKSLLLNFHRSIGFKILLSVVGTIFLTNGLLAYLYLTVQEKRLNETTVRTASQLSETIKKSIQYDMLQNRKEHAYKIMETIGMQEGIEKVRIYSCAGKVVFSSDPSEEGRTMDKAAEPCRACHAAQSPAVTLSVTERSRIHDASGDYRLRAGGHRFIGIINPMYNEASCARTSCHEQPEIRKVLGIIDITMSLADIDREIVQARSQVIYLNIAAIVLFGSAATLILFRFIERPVKELVLGTRRIADGDLDHVIPVATADEMGHLASSFNRMTHNLKKAREEIQEGIRNLERKVDERTEELRNAQNQLIRSEKLIALGKLAATVAHEINNPLAGVFTYIKLMERRIEQGRHGPEDLEMYGEYLATMRREVERTAAIVRNLLDFTRPKDPVRQRVDLTRLVGESLALVGNKLSLANITIVNRLPPLPEVMADPSQIKQVFINIMVNSCEAMEGGGKLRIWGSVKEAEDAITLNFYDTGVGITFEDLARVFDPFFTTKEKGTGLGLSVVHGIVKRHNGSVEVRSRPGKGTLIAITLPIT